LYVEITNLNLHNFPKIQIQITNLNLWKRV